MYTVGRLGSYISKGVYTVSGPFHPFGGAVDIIVVEQQDGSFKSSPWYVRFGKFQGVLKAKEKVVNISVDGIEADFHMYLDSKGEAYFLREVDVEEGGGDSVLSPLSSGEDTDGQSGGDTRPMKSKSCNFDANGSNLVTEIGISNGKVLARTNSRRSRILGLVFGRKSVREEDDGSGVVRVGSLERAEIAADLLELKWSTNLASSRYKKMITSQSAPESVGREEDEAVDSPLNDNKVSLNVPMSNEEPGIHDNGMSNSSWDGLPKLDSSEDGVEMLCLSSNHIGRASSSGESGLQENYDLDSQTVREVYKLRDSDYDENSKGFISEATSPNQDSADLNVSPINKLDEELVFKEEESGVATLEAFSYCEMEEAGDSSEKTQETLCVSCKGSVEACVHAKMLHEIAEIISEVKSVQDTSLLVAKEPLDFPEVFLDGNCGNLFNDAQIRGSEGTCSDSSGNSSVTETHAQMVIVEEISSAKEVESCSIYTVSGFDNSISEVQDGEKTRESPIANSQEFMGDNFSIGPLTVSPSQSSSEEQLLFGDMDDFNQGDIKCMESSCSNQVENENHPPAYFKTR